MHNTKQAVLQQTVEQIIQKNGETTPSKSAGVVCEYCGVIVPTLELEVFGKIRIVQPVCKCVAKRQKAKQLYFENYQHEKDIQRLLGLSDVGKRYENATLDNFIVRSGTENALKLAQYYEAHFDKENANALLFFGEPGNGKTHLAAAIHNSLVVKGYSVVFITMPELLNKIRATFSKTSKDTKEAILQALASCDLVIIDDIGAEKISDWVEETIYTIFDVRYRRNRPIITTSNLTTDEICFKLGRRIHDRLLEMCQPVYNSASSYRKELAQKRSKKISALIKNGNI